MFVCVAWRVVVRRSMFPVKRFVDPVLPPMVSRSAMTTEEELEYEAFKASRRSVFGVSPSTFSQIATAAPTLPLPGTLNCKQTPTRRGHLHEHDNVCFSMTVPRGLATALP